MYKNNFNTNSVDKNLLFLYLDVETTGLESTTCGLIEVGGVFEYNGEIIQEFELLINPYTYPFPVEVQEKALAVNNRTIPEIQTFLNQKDCLDWLCQTTKYYTAQFNCNRPFIVGYNVNFDMGFIQAWFNTNNIKFAEHFQYKSIDVLQLVMTLGYLGVIDPFDNNLKDMCLKFDIDLTNAHTAVADIKATRELYKKLLTLLPLATWINPNPDIAHSILNMSKWGSKDLCKRFGIEYYDMKTQYNQVG